MFFVRICLISWFILPGLIPAVNNESAGKWPDNDEDAGHFCGVLLLHSRCNNSGSWTVDPDNCFMKNVCCVKSSGLYPGKNNSMQGADIFWRQIQPDDSAIIGSPIFCIPVAIIIWESVRPPLWFHPGGEQTGRLPRHYVAVRFSHAHGGIWCLPTKPGYQHPTQTRWSDGFIPWSGPGEDRRKNEQKFVRWHGPKIRLPTIFRSGPGDVPNFGEKSHRVTGTKISRLLLTPQMGWVGPPQFWGGLAWIVCGDKTERLKHLLTTWVRLWNYCNGVQKIFERTPHNWGTQWTRTLKSGGLYIPRHVQNYSTSGADSPGPWKREPVFLFLSRSRWMFFPVAILSFF